MWAASTTSVMTWEAMNTVKAHPVMEVHVYDCPPDSVTADMQLMPISVQQCEDCKWHIITLHALLQQKLHNTHIHPFNTRTTRVSRYQKGKTNLDFTEARDSEWQWHQLGHMQVCTSLQTDNHASTHHSVFYRLDALPAAQPTASKHWRQKLHNNFSKHTVKQMKHCTVTNTEVISQSEDMAEWW